VKRRVLSLILFFLFRAIGFKMNGKSRVWASLYPVSPTNTPSLG